MRTRKRGGVRGGPTRSRQTKKTKALTLYKPTISLAQISKAISAFEGMGIKNASDANVRSILESTSDRNLSKSARNLKKRYIDIVDNSIRQLQHASRLEVITEKHQKAYAENTRSRRSEALRHFSFRSPKKSIASLAQTYYKRIDPEFASYFLNYVHETFVRNTTFQPMLVPSHYGSPKAYVDPKVQFNIETVDEEKEIDEYTDNAKHKIMTYLTNQGREPSFSEFPDDSKNININHLYKDEYLACGTLYVNVNRFTSPLTDVVKDHYPSTYLYEHPLYFVFQTPKSVIMAHESHVSILVLHNAIWYSIGLGYSGKMSSKSKGGDKRVGLYNPDHVIGIGGVDSSKIPHHLRLIDMGIFYKKHLDRILDLVTVGKFQNPMTLEFGDTNDEKCGGLSSQIISLNMPYKYITCANTNPSSLNCTSFAQYVFRERIECRPIQKVGIVHPSNCKRKQKPLTMEKLQTFIKEYKKNDTISPQLLDDLTWEA